MAIGWMSSLSRHVADDAVGAGVLRCHARDVVAVARDEGDVCAAVEQVADERQARARRCRR